MLTHTLDSLKQTIDRAPKFFPADRRKAMLEEASMVTDDKKAEELIVSFGKEIWPFRKAFWHIHDTDGRAKEAAAIKDGIADEALKEKLAIFLRTDGTIADIGRGTAAFERFFTPDEKAALVEAKLNAHDRIVADIESLCVGPKKDVCENHLADYKNKVSEIEKLLEGLRRLAVGSEKWGPEILDKIHTYDLGWSGAEREPSADAVRGDIDFYQGVVEVTE